MKGVLIFVLAVSSIACAPPAKNKAIRTTEHPHAKPKDVAVFKGERRFVELKQLTSGGENSVASFVSDTQLIFQSTRDGFQCDQLFRMNLDGSGVQLVSTGLGLSIHGSAGSNDRILYSSSHVGRVTCPPKRDPALGYAWPLLSELDVFSMEMHGAPNAVSESPGFDGEARLSPSGDRIVFSSARGGDVDIWSMLPDGSDARRLTSERGYEGGAAFSRDGRKLVYLAQGKGSSVLSDGRPSALDIWVMDTDGGNKTRVLQTDSRSVAPSFHPDGEHIVFGSNLDDPNGSDYDLYLVGIDGKGLERLTFNPSFDGFPEFSADGSALVFTSVRDGDKPQLLVAKWRVDAPQPPLLSGVAAIAASSWKQRVEAFAGADMQGRGLGTEGLKRAVSWLEDEFRRVGLAAVDNGFRQEFQVAAESELAEAKLEIGGKNLDEGVDFTAFNFSHDAVISGEAVFVGFGITSPAYGYDDYAGEQLDGKIAVVLRYEPQRTDATSQFAGERPIRESDLRYKVVNAKHHGARAVIVVNPEPTGAENDTLYPMEGIASSVGIPALHLTWAAATRVLDTDRIRKIQASLDSAQTPEKPVSLNTDVRVKVRIVRKPATVTNVVGVLRADSGPRAGAIVIGAHIDHLGMGGEGSLRPGVAMLHPGADDNASGVATLLELAESLAAQKGRVRDIYFVGFTAEESGLLGSQHFVDNHSGPIAAMMNLDMVGRLDADGLTVLGVDTATGFRNTLRRAQNATGLRLKMAPDGYGPSDHMSFYLADVPVMSFFTGVHPEYHTPDDTVDKLNVDGALVVGRFVFEVARELATDSTDPVFRRVRASAPRSEPAHGKNNTRPSFGSIPAPGGENVDGVKVSGARQGSPADQAGLLAGDIIVKFGTFDIKSLRDLAFALRQHNVGDTVEVVVVRGSAQVILRASLRPR